MEIFFLGTGGGRFATITQRRRTGGIRVTSGKVNMHVDPGPGGLIYSIEAGLDPRKINAVLISHSHPDHYNDGEVLIEAMTGGALKRAGILVCSRSVTVGNEECGPSVSKYHKGLCEKVFELGAGEGCKFFDVEVKALKAVHYDPDTIGFRLTFLNGEVLGYTSDTEYFEGAGSQYSGADALILCVIRPRGAPLKWHMCVDDAVKILQEAQPKRALLTHFGMRMITGVDPKVEAKYVEKQTGVPTVAADDEMHVKIERKEDLTKFF